MIAASGYHNILMVGPPGSGKTMLAKRLPTIMSNLTFEESLELTKIYSIAGEINNNEKLITKRPFRSPLHSISSVGLVGGGQNPKPGEISLSNYGILFLDEFTEFRRDVLESLRQPLEDRVVSIVRAKGSIDLPSKFMLVATMNPCPCGFYGQDKCTCSQYEVAKYVKKISGPLLDRIDLHIQVDYIENLGIISKGKPSKELKQDVMNALQMQKKRYKNESIKFNADLSAQLIKKYCILDTESHNLLDVAYRNMSLSTRSVHRILILARTIADLENKDAINREHILEALFYRQANDFSRGQF